MIEAKNVTNEYIDELNKKKYVIIMDHASGKIFNNMIKAINLFADKGWKCVNITVMASGERLGLTHVIYALMEQI